MSRRAGADAVDGDSTSVSAGADLPRVRDAIGLLETLVRIPSPSGDEDAIQRFVAAELAAAGLEVSEIPVDAHSSADGAPDVVGVLRGTGSGRSLLLCGHVDTVPVGDEAPWTVPPLGAVVVEERLWGRGACDMKAGVAAALSAVRAVAERGPRLRGDLIMLTTVQEEVGGLGAIAYAHSLAGSPGPDAAIVTEPTSLAVAPAHAGGCYASITIPGKSAHAGSRRLGVSAIEKLAIVLDAIAEFEASRNEALRRHPGFSHLEQPAPINVGTVNGGEWAGSVATSVTCAARIAILPGEDVPAVRTDFAAAVTGLSAHDKWLRENPPRIDWMWSMPACSIPMSSPIIGELRDALTTASGRPPEIRGMPYGADMAHLVEIASIPSVLFGPGDIALAHQADEHVPLAEVITAAEALALCACHWCA
jgi:acetylornithine deacetylase